MNASEMKFIESAYEEVPRMRAENKKFATIHPVLFSEFLVETAACYAIVAEKEIGYFCINENRLIDFCINRDYNEFAAELIRRIIREYDVKLVTCLSENTVEVNACLRLGFAYKTFLNVFNEYDESFEPVGDMTFRPASGDDYEMLLAEKNGLYELPEELSFYVSGNPARRLLLFYREEQFVGAGYLTLIPLQDKAVDIGMWVRPMYRGKGIAVQIVAYLKRIVIAEGKLPVCTCMAENHIARYVLQRNGFRNTCDLIAFTPPLR